VDFIGTSKKDIVKHRHVSDSARIHAIAYLPNKTEDLVLGDGKGTLRLWTVRQGKERTVTEAHSQEILALTVDQSGTKIASGGIDKRIKFWDDNLNRVFEIPEAHAKYITALRFLPDGQHIASGGGDHKVRIWDVRTGQNVSGPFSGHKGDIEGIEFSPDGKYMFTASEDKTIKIWEVEAGKLLYTLVAFVDGSYIVYDNDRYFASKQQFSASRAIEEMLRKPAPR
jgi:WD40 repeat protein